MAIFLLFIFITIVLLWLFQIALLDNFYYMFTKRQMRHTAEEIVDSSGTQDFSAMVASLASEAGFCVVVYVITDEGMAESRASVEESLGCIVHHLTPNDLNNLYYNALESDGALYIRYVTPDEREEPEGGAVTISHEGNPSRTATYLVAEQEQEREDLTGERLVLIDIRENAQGQRMVVLIDCAMSPVGSIANTLRMQLFAVTLIMLVLSFFIAWMLSRRIAVPIERLNAGAKQLAQGKYETDFSVQGYREVCELSQTLNTAAEELSKLDRMQKELIGNVSHDLRTPLTMIIGYAEVIRDIKEENTPENVQVIIDEATRLSTLVSDLLEVSRYHAGGMALHLGRFNIAAEIRDTVTRYRHLKENDGFTFTCEGVEEAMVYADRDRMLQVVCNLLNNAINYSRDDRHIRVRLLIDGDTFRCQVIDRGVGIPKEELTNIWTRYYKVERTQGRAGSGLGLAIVRTILTQHGARYGVASTLGEGSCFWFELPLSLEEPGSPEHPGGPGSPEHSAGTESDGNSAPVLPAP